MERIAVDSYVFIDIILHSPKEQVAKKKLQLAMEKGAIVSSVALLEVKYQIMKKLGHEKAEEAIFLIKNSPNMKIIDMNHTIAETAADVRFKYYKNKEREMSYADAVHIATAITNGCDRIITGDPDFRDIDEIKTEIY